MEEKELLAKPLQEIEEILKSDQGFKLGRLLSLEKSGQDRDEVKSFSGIGSEVWRWRRPCRINLVLLVKTCSGFQPRMNSLHPSLSSSTGS